ncbi:HlyB/MsbA family ABC transporter [Acrocarpospora pleiomorpha]|uniref:HlyB/MsbA family ABC transporter n=1 Tax=Acrocarpospora pleiomorpha TaxID=90975 RepID=A0A5M3XFY1_9ACTN|nr:ABC transporter ATP-binding protein [Acrocarpospora pleiomorpha]GES20507.1 HlyB/MsbA family ABC transporter [Acrocarpospora pleiomorpha]
MDKPEISAHGAEQPPGNGKPPERFTIDDLMPGAEGPRDWRRLPRLVRTSFRLAWRAAPRELLISCGLQVFNGVATFVQLLIGREVLQALLGSTGLGPVIPSVVALVLVGALQRFATAAEQEQSELLRELVTQHAQSSVLDVAARIDLAEFESPAFFNRLQRVSMGGGMRSMEMVHGLFGLARAAAGAAGAVAVLLVLQPLLVPLLAVTALPLWIVTRKNSQDTFRFFVGITALERARHYLASLFTDRQSVKEVRAFGLGGYLRGRYDRLGAERVRELRAVTRQRLRRSLLGGVSSAFLTGVTFAVLAWLYVSGRLDLASAGVAAAALTQMAGTLAMTGMSVAHLYGASLFVQDYEEFLAQGSAIPRERGTRLPAFRELRAEGVTFVYPGSTAPAVRNVSLTIKAGEVIALVGENGSGKTTLAKLLAQLYRPTSGHIWWDGTDTATCDEEALRDFITVIFQDFVKYHLSGRENIGFGRHERLDDLEAIRDSARLADADEFLSRLPEAYETVLGKEFTGGTDLSVGQWQRVALARAFFRDAPFIVLDEPTASLDARAEHELFQRIRDLFRGRTVLLISHRFSTVRSADHIYVLHGGEIEERGSHEELMASGGRYSELFTLQAAAFLDPEAGR